jgi:dihydroneopterin aldolase
MTDAMLTITLEDMKFYAGHGNYPEEKILGNTFLVDTSVSIEQTTPVTRLSQTVDYEKLYEIVAGEMHTRANMLETLGERCVRHIKEAFPAARVIELKISKLHPPIGGEVARSTVTLRKTF